MLLSTFKLISPATQIHPSAPQYIVGLALHSPEPTTSFYCHFRWRGSSVESQLSLKFIFKLYVFFTFPVFSINYYSLLILSFRSWKIYKNAFSTTCRRLCTRPNLLRLQESRKLQRHCSTSRSRDTGSAFSPSCQVRYHRSRPPRFHRRSSASHQQRTIRSANCSAESLR